MQEKLHLLRVRAELRQQYIGGEADDSSSRYKFEVLAKAIKRQKRLRDAERRRQLESLIYEAWRK
eukprot:1370791-Pyramimonas_sp.AAC.1